MRMSALFSPSTRMPALLEHRVPSFYPKVWLPSSVHFISAMSSGAVNGHALGSADDLICRQDSLPCRAVTTAVANRTADMSQTQPLNSATTDRPSPALVGDDPYICPRTDTVEKLAELLDKKRVVHVRGTPCSGKTTLAMLLWDYYRERGERVVFLNGWHNVRNPRIHLVDECNAYGYYGVEPHTLTKANVVFIFDEAQQSYDNGDLWSGIIKTQSGSHAGPKICLFSSYGSPATGPTDHPSKTTPIHIGPSQRISITASRFASVCLFYSREEFEDVVNRRCSNPTSKFELDPAAREYLYSITNGHPGATDALLDFIFMVCMSCSIY